MSEHRILQSVLTVTAASVLVCGSLLLLTSTAPWKRLPPDSDATMQGLPRFADAAPEEDQADAPTAFATAADGAHTASTPIAADTQQLPEPVELAQSTAADLLSPTEPEIAALGTPLNQETADPVEDIGPDGPTAEAEAPDLASATEAQVAVAVSGPPVPDLPEAVARADATRDQTADLLTALIARVIAGETTDAATGEVAGMLATLPPAPPVPVASEKTEPATIKVAGLLADLPSPPTAVVAADPPPPLPRRKPEAPPEPKVAVAAPPVETTSQPKLAAAAAPPREKPAPRETQKQQAAIQSGGPLGIWKPMALAPADEPSVSLSKPATARPSGKAYASQVWAKLARHKPRAGQRGAASVSFAISANGTLGAVRIARSSGNSRIDQLALQTVRVAAPFPPPPSGAASYTIRIDFP